MTADGAPRTAEKRAKLRLALVGAGFWSRYHLAGWLETGDVECVAICDRNPGAARALAARCGVAACTYSDAHYMLDAGGFDFVDIVTGPESHAELVKTAAQFRHPVICQKPLAQTYEDAVAVEQFCRDLRTPLYVHENWRWQAPIRELKRLIDAGEAGRIFRARLRMVSGFPVFENQPSLRNLHRFLLADIGSHILDVARFLFGEARSVYCTTKMVQSGIAGEDVATVVLVMQSGATVICEMGYPGKPLAIDYFPQTFAFVEGDEGTIELGSGYELRCISAHGCRTVSAPPPQSPWMDPDYAVVHASIVPCHLDLLAGLRAERTPETTAADNLKTLRLVQESYASAESNEVIHL